MTVSSDLLAPIAILIIIVFSLFRRMMRNRNGAKYSVRAIFFTPIIYMVLTAFLVIGLSAFQDLAVVVAVIVGALAGLVLGKRSEIFEKDGNVMYRRSTEVMAIWLIGFVVRIALDFVSNPFFNGTATNSSSTSISSIFAAYSTSPVLFGADLLLAFSAGMLFGEAYILYKNYNSKYKTRKG